MSIQPPTFRLLRNLPARLVRGLDPAVCWLRRELDTARRENLDAQFLATPRGSVYRWHDVQG